MHGGPDAVTAADVEVLVAGAVEVPLALVDCALVVELVAAWV